MFKKSKKNTVQTQMLIHTHAHPITMSTSERLCWYIILRLTKPRHMHHSQQECLLSLNAHRRKIWNKSRKIRAPVSSLRLEPWWAGDITILLTIQ